MVSVPLVEGPGQLGEQWPTSMPKDRRNRNKRQNEAGADTVQALPRAAEVSGPGQPGQTELSIAEALLWRVEKYIRASFQQHGAEFETGGMLTGEFSLQQGVPRFRLNGLIGAGPRAECSADSVLFDGDYQLRVLQAVRARHPRVGNMGCIHFHPGQMDECSAGDFVADLAAVKESDTKALVFGIVTKDNPRRDPFSVYLNGLKMDFFVLGEHTGFEYAHVKPLLDDTPLAEVEPGRQGEGVADSPAFNQLGFLTHHAWFSGLLEDKRRLVAEVRTMEERYGQRAVLRHQRNQLYWEYTVTESGRSFPIEVRYPRRYPLEPPRIISVLPLPSSPHQLVNNELCWINRAMGEWNPSRDTAATCIHAAHRWFACLLVYLTLGKWPEEANDEPVRAA